MPTADVAGLCDLVRSCDCALLAGPSQLTLAAALAALDLSVARRGSVMVSASSRTLQSPAPAASGFNACFRPRSSS